MNLVCTREAKLPPNTLRVGVHDAATAFFRPLVDVVHIKLRQPWKESNPGTGNARRGKHEIILLGNEEPDVVHIAGVFERVIFGGDELLLEERAKEHAVDRADPAQEALLPERWKQQLVQKKEVEVFRVTHHQPVEQGRAATGMAHHEDRLLDAHAMK